MEEGISKWKRTSSSPLRCMSFLNPHPNQTHSRPSLFLHWQISSYERGGALADLGGIVGGTAGGRDAGSSRNPLPSSPLATWE